MGSRRTLSAPANDLGLAVAVVALILIGALLAALGSISFVVPADAVDLNAATSEGLAVALEVDLALTDRLVAERERIGRFSSVAEVANVSVIAERDRSSTRTVLRKLDVNAASSGDLATALALPRALAERLTAHRATRPLGRWRSAEDVVRAPVLDPRGVDAMRDRLIVRTPGWALATTLGWALLASALLAVAFGIERRLVPTADRWLLAMAAVPAGLYVAIGVGFQDPLREAVPLGHAVVGLAAGLGIFLVAARTFARRPGGDAAAGTLRSSEQWAVTAFVVWAAGCAATAAGARIGAPGVVWLGPFLAVLVVGVSMRRQAALGPGRLRPGSLGRATRQTSRPLPLLAITAPAWATLVALLVTRDGGVAAMCGVACSLVLYVGNQALWSVAGVVCTASFVWLASLVGLSSAREAVVTWMSPWVAPGSTVPASAQALWAIASGGVWGSGLGLGQPGHGVSGNFAASLSEDLGLLGLAVVLLALTAVVWRCCGVAIRGNGDRDRLLGAVVGGLIAAQSALSVGGATGLLPGMGIPIPFASDSRLLQFVWFGLLGVVCGVSGTLGRVAIGADRVAFRRRLTSIASGFALLTLGLGGVRAGYLQTFAADRIAGSAVRMPSGASATGSVSNPRLANLARSVERGAILDSQGRVLATSGFRAMSAALASEPGTARRHFRAGRYYPYGQACAPVVGLWTPRHGAIVGAENEFDAHLRGFRSLGDLLPLYRAKDLPAWLRPRPRRGGDVVLTLNAVLQEDGLRILERAVSATGDGPRGRAALVVLHAVRGHPIVAVSVPSIDPNRVVLRDAGAGGAPGPPLAVTDHAVAMLTAPPGPFKVASALAAGDEGAAIRRTCKHTETGLEWSDGDALHTVDFISDDPLDPAHGSIGMERAVKVSCNTWFAGMAVTLGPDLLYRRMTGLLGDGVLPSRREYGRRLPEIAAGIGGILVSPTDMAALMATLTSGMAPVKPAYGHELRFSDGRPPQPVQRRAPERRVGWVSDDTAKAIRRALVEAVSEGPVYEVFEPLRITVAGKAASVPRPDAAGRPDAWFVGFAPGPVPAYSFACWIEGGGSGSRTAAPVVREMLREMVGP